MDDKQIMCSSSTLPAALQRLAPPQDTFEWYSVCSRHQKYIPECLMCNVGDWENKDYHALEKWLYAKDPELWRVWTNRGKHIIRQRSNK
jgi:hypothetical protein